MRHRCERSTPISEHQSQSTLPSTAAEWEPKIYDVSQHHEKVPHLHDFSNIQLVWVQLSVTTSKYVCIQHENDVQGMLIHNFSLVQTGVGPLVFVYCIGSVMSDECVKLVHLCIIKIAYISLHQEKDLNQSLTPLPVKPCRPSIHLQCFLDQVDSYI